MDCDVVAPHVGSYDYLCEGGARKAALAVPPETFQLNDDRIELRYTDLKLEKPTLGSVPRAKKGMYKEDRLLPSECRQRGVTYSAEMVATIEISINGSHSERIDHPIGYLPVMLHSRLCHLRGRTEEEQIAMGEEPGERGGYFIVKGSEKVVRILVGNRRNFPIALRRRAFMEKGKLFTDCGIMIRCFQDCHTCALVTLHYVENRTIQIALQYRGEIFYTPLVYVMRAMSDHCDGALFALLKGSRQDAQWLAVCHNMIRQTHIEKIIDRRAALIALGGRFRVALGDKLAPWHTDEEVGQMMLDRCVLIHLDSADDKLRMLAYMSQKLFALVNNEIQPESPDNPQFWEATLSGHILLLMLRERLEELLGIVRRRVFIAKGTKTSSEFMFSSTNVIRALGSPYGQFTHGFEYFLATGTLVTKNGLGLMQRNGFSVIAERINQMRFLSHFRAIHRGAFFTEMRTTDPRKLRPEAFGFVCPVHTPDGAPCGLLNHLTATCEIVTHHRAASRLSALLVEMGVEGRDLVADSEAPHLIPVLVDGRHAGYAIAERAERIATRLRSVKVSDEDGRLPPDAEVTFIPRNKHGVPGQYPGLYIFTSPARLLRPVRNVQCDRRELIGTFEQVYLGVALEAGDLDGTATHQELHPTSLFSLAANLIPFPDHNQSPRNVYQCQMGKQTMGTAVHAWPKRADNKMYRLMFPQHPLLRLPAYEKSRMDDYPSGTNACVAVISYTGYDMEDAMVMNRGSYQRGFAHGTIVKVERVNLWEEMSRGRRIDSDDPLDCPMIFMQNPERPEKGLDEFGLPIPGRLYREGEVYYTTFDVARRAFKSHKFKTEVAFCSSVRAVSEPQCAGIVHVLIEWRIPRNPIIGDKFASRHGQKGINSVLWAAESLPWSETGQPPDILFNPHGFPSRMTIGMMIESMAGKAAAVHADVYDGSPFVYNEKRTAIDHFGELLQAAGYNYYGNETFYSGVDGRQMEVQIFFGVVYYQRLRHMIADKFQVRATGPVDPVTLQPIKGRKRGGGIRFGEMERDAIIAHGTAFVLQDRLLTSSDRDSVPGCARCGSLLSCFLTPADLEKKRRDDAEMAEIKRAAGGDGKKGSRKSGGTQKAEDYVGERVLCQICGKDDEVYFLQVPRVLRYLTAELASVNVKLKFGIRHPDEIRR